MATTADASPRSRWAPAQVGRLDLVVVAALTAAAAVRRRGMLPTSGLWFDDSWVAAGVVLGSPSQILTVGSTHPTFTLLLMAVDRAGGGLAALAAPALLAGVAAPPALYVLARRCGAGAVAAAFAASILVASRIPLMYAGRVKAYTIEVLAVVVTAGLVALLARARWRWPHAAGWVAFAWFVGGFGGTLLVVTGVAGAVLVLHAAGDRPARLAAVAVQGAGQLWFYAEARRRVDLDGIDGVIAGYYDAHLDVDANPVRFAGELAEHLRRIGELYPALDGLPAVAAVLLAVAGLGLSAGWGRARGERIVGRFLLALVAAAFVGGIVGLLPFGATNDIEASAGGRYNLWLVAPLAFGTAVLLHRAGEVLPGLARRAAAAALVAGAVVVVAWGGLPAGPEYPFGGSTLAAERLDELVGPGDRVILNGPAAYAIPLGLPDRFHLVDTPELQVGFIPLSDDGSYLTVGAWSPDGAPVESYDLVPGHIADADRVFLVGALPLIAGSTAVNTMLEQAGFANVDILTADDGIEAYLISVWIRDQRG